MSYTPSISPFNLDSSSRTRVSQLTTQLDGKVLGQDDTILFENTGTSAAVYANNKVNLPVAANQYLIRQSKRRGNYYAGKSQLVECTFDNFQTEATVTKRIGYFSSSATAPYNANLDGFFIEDDGTVKSLQTWRNGVQTSNVLFTVMNNATAITSQNWTNFNVVAFDFLWLGGAVLRFFVKTNNGFELIHTINYAGSAPDVFILSPNQPVRYEVRSAGLAGSLRYVCSQVSTEGSIFEMGKSQAIFNTTGITTNVLGTIYALKSYRKQAAFRDITAKLTQSSVNVSTSADAGIMLVILNPTLSAAITYVNRGKIQEGTPTNQTITANTGRILFAAGVTSASANSGIIDDNQYNDPGVSLANTLDEIVLAYIPTVTNQTVHGIMNIEEY